MTSRMVLRRFTEGDLSGLLALDSDPEVMRFLGPVRSRAEIQASTLPRFLAFHAGRPGFGYWAARERAGGELIGWFGLRPVMPAGTAIVDWPDAPPGTAPGGVAVAELGYRLRRSAWGRGYGTEGARALVRHAFTGLGVSRVVATTMTVNTASRRVLEKAGLGQARTLHLHWPDPLPGDEHGEAEYELRRDDWPLVPGHDGEWAARKEASNGFPDRCSGSADPARLDRGRATPTGRPRTGHR